MTPQGAPRVSTRCFCWGFLFLHYWLYLWLICCPWWLMGELECINVNRPNICFYHYGSWEWGLGSHKTSFSRVTYYWPFRGGTFIVLLFVKWSVMFHWHMIFFYQLCKLDIQLTLVISTSLISNNRLSRSENLVPAYIWKPNNRWKIL